MKFRLRTGLVSALLLVCSVAHAQRGVPQLDSALAALVASAVFDSLRGHGWGHDIRWVAGDSATFAALAPEAARRRIMLAPPSDSLVLCPDMRHVLAESRTLSAGYQVLLSTRTDSGRVYLSVQADCRVQRGRSPRPERLQEGRSWEVAKDARGWRIVREYMRWAT